jgi:peptidyl-dipeptidase Dcp
MDHWFGDIFIRTSLRSGDLGYLTFLHGIFYNQEMGYGLLFEAYVAAGLASFYENYDEQKDAVWICEKDGVVIGSLVLAHRENAQAQLRYFLLHPQHRGHGLGQHLLQLFIQTLKEKKYTGAYLLTTEELPAAASLYARFGFRLVEEKSSPIFGKPVKEQRYELRF